MVLSTFQAAAKSCRKKLQQNLFPLRLVFGELRTVGQDRARLPQLFSSAKSKGSQGPWSHAHLENDTGSHGLAPSGLRSAAPGCLISYSLQRTRPFPVLPPTLHSTPFPHYQTPRAEDPPGGSAGHLHIWARGADGNDGGGRRRHR